MGRIWALGLGADAEEITMRAAALIRSGKRVVLRTGRCTHAAWLKREQITYATFDALYESAEDFDELNRTIAGEVIKMAEQGDVIYCAADLRDESVKELSKMAQVEYVPGVPVDAALLARADGPVVFLSAEEARTFLPNSAVATVVREIDSRTLASEVKLQLMRRYPDAQIVHLATMEGGVIEIPLTDLDRQKRYNHLTALLVPAVRDVTLLERYGFDDLNVIVQRLRAPDGCPWDREQTHNSLRTSVVEEAYEVVEAIEDNDMNALYDELGDVLLQVSLHAEIAREHGEFDIDDVTTAVCRKMISRHPHIFANAQAETSDDVLKLWENVKKTEKNVASEGEAMRGVTKSLPALLRAEKVQKKARNAGFDFSGPLDALAKVGEESEEVRQAIVDGPNIEEEVGDLLFSVVNVARLCKIPPENALMRATDKFIRRYQTMERLICEAGLEIGDMDLAKMDDFWSKAKQSQ